VTEETRKRGWEGKRQKEREEDERQREREGVRGRREE
jgi:hypothetical protein